MSGLDSLMQELQDENERLASNGNDFLKNFVRLPEKGNLIMRFLGPALPGMFDRQKSPFYASTRVHRVNDKSLHCPKTLVGGRYKGVCPICDYYSWLWKQSEEDGLTESEVTKLQNKARAIKPIDRFYYNVMVRQQYNEETSKMETNVGPLIFSCGKTVHQKIIRAIVGDENKKPLGDITSVTAGRDFKLVKALKKGASGSYPVYDDSEFLDPSSLGNPDEIETWTKNVHDLLALRIVKSADELKHELKVHLGLVPDKSTDFDPTEYQEKVDEATISDEVAAYAEQANMTSKTSVSVNTDLKATEEANKKAGSELLSGTDSIVDDDFLNELRNA